MDTVRSRNRSKNIGVYCLLQYMTADIIKYFTFSFWQQKTKSFIHSAIFLSTEVVYLQRWHGWWHMKLQPSRRKSCAHQWPYNHAPCHFMQSHICKVYSCLAVTCHLHFWQNDRDLLCATVVTQGWNRYRNKSQHRKSTMEKKILLPFQQGFKPATFQSRVRHSNHWAIPAPRKWTPKKNLKKSYKQTTLSFECPTAHWYFTSPARSIQLL